MSEILNSTEWKEVAEVANRSGFDSEVAEVQAKIRRLVANRDLWMKQYDEMKTLSIENHDRAERLCSDRHGMIRDIVALRGVAEILTRLNADDGLSPAALWHLRLMARHTLDNLNNGELVGP